MPRVQSSFGPLIKSVLPKFQSAPPRGAFLGFHLPFLKGRTMAVSLQSSSGALLPRVPWPLGNPLGARVSQLRGLKGGLLVLGLKAKKAKKAKKALLAKIPTALFFSFPPFGPVQNGTRGRATTRWSYLKRTLKDPKKQFSRFPPLGDQRVKIYKKAF